MFGITLLPFYQCKKIVHGVSLLSKLLNFS